MSNNSYVVAAISVSIASRNAAELLESCLSSEQLTCFNYSRQNNLMITVDVTYETFLALKNFSVSADSIANEASIGLADSTQTTVACHKRASISCNIQATVAGLTQATISGRSQATLCDS